MEMRRLLEAVQKYSGGPDQKQGKEGQLLGSDTMPKKGSKVHPANHQLVGSCEESILKDLSKTSKKDTLEWRLAEEYANFAEDDLGVEPRRPERAGSRGEQFGTRGHKEVPRYNTIKEEPQSELDEELKYRISVTRRQLQELAKLATADDSETWASICSKVKGGAFVGLTHNIDNISKILEEIDTQQVDEYGANQPTGTAAQTNNPTTGAVTPAPVIPSATGTAATQPATVDPKQVANASTATNIMKSATHATAPAANIDQSLNAVSTDKASQQDMKNLKPMVDVINKASEDPALANQFKNLAAKANQVR